ncbi:hypothetical protein BDV19DRAFT_355566 [Aspergillus venezuelensis]
MPKFTAIIKYDNHEAYQQHGNQIEQIAKDLFASKGATDLAPFFSTRSMPPSHRTSFNAPDGTSPDDLKNAGLPEGVSCDIAQA